LPTGEAVPIPTLCATEVIDKHMQVMVRKNIDLIILLFIKTDLCILTAKGGVTWH
jgi:hypothetical protein